jgi:hypothetical protein
MGRSLANVEVGAQLARRAATDPPCAVGSGMTTTLAWPVIVTEPDCRLRLAVGDVLPAPVTVEVIVPPAASICFCSESSEEEKTEAGVSPDVIRTGVIVDTSVALWSFDT